MTENKSVVYFADAQLEKMEQAKSLPAKLKRLVRKMNFAGKIKGKKVGIKMHFGWGLNFTTIHPVFIKALVEEIMAEGAKEVKIIDDNAKNGIGRGYLREIVGCPAVSTFGETWKYGYWEKIGFKSIDKIFFSGEALDSEFLINLSHLKGHGDCGFGGAIKNIGMGMVDNPSRRKLHHLEGAIVYDKNKCNYCLKCAKVCQRDAIGLQSAENKKKGKKEIEIFTHNCTYCQHCIIECPRGALKMNNRNFNNFAKGMAVVTSKFLKKLNPENMTYINFLTNITIYCDCWGFSSPPIVPDIGILGSSNICAIETASLDMIKTENLLEKGLPKDQRELLDNKGHLFEKIHAKNPYLMINYLSKYSGFTTGYKLDEVN
ncbi:MAG: DUF362 domain-containing protein [Elusimicrobia bacterium]|nr:DUF362 domain-containing protein [Elusimicrobiota bacterium]MBU2614168.1 DUF362 domain-containing protein [Elusimicrobiota bacterium]